MSPLAQAWPQTRHRQKSELENFMKRIHGNRCKLAFQAGLMMPLNRQDGSRNMSYCHLGGLRCSVGDEKTKEAESSAMTAAAAALILKHGARAYMYGQGRRPSPTAMRASMEQLEKVQKKNGVKSPVEKLYGQWRLVFTAAKKTSNPLTSNLFFPVRAHQTFTRDSKDPSEHDGEFDNAVFLLGPAAFFRVIGPMRWVTTTNRLEFSVDRLKIKIGPFEWEKEGFDKKGYSLKRRTAKTLPFFTFFCIRDDIMVARARSGGLALYARVPDDKHL